MADRTIKPDDTNDLVLQNNDGSSKLELNEDQTVKVTTGSDAGEYFTVNTSQLVVEGDTGNVGIGTDDPQKTLDVKGTFAISNNTSSYWDFDRHDSSGTLIISNTTTPRMRLDTSGNILLNTASTSVGNLTAGFITVDLSGDSKHALNINSLAENFSAIGIRKHNTAGTSYPMYIINSSNTNVGSISMTNTAVAFNTSSDYRLKENVTPLTGAIDRLNQLKPSRFNFIADPETTLDGFLAHEVSGHVPEAVSGEKDQVDEDGEIQPQGIDQSKLVPLLVASVQELSAKVTALENA